MLAFCSRCLRASEPVFSQRHPQVVVQKCDVQARRIRGIHTATKASQDTSRPPYKILFAGSDRFSCASLDQLVKPKRELVQELHVLVSPDKRTSRGLKEVRRPLLRTRAEELGLPVHVLPVEGIKAWQPPVPFDTYSPCNLLITASFGHLIPTRLLNFFPPLNALNVHPSLLPRYRGAAPIQWAIMNGDRETGVTVQSLSKGRFDEGMILAQNRMDLWGSESYEELETHLADAGGKLLVQTLQNLSAAQEKAWSQDPSLILLAPKLLAEHACIDWSNHPPQSIHRRHRGISHQFPLWTTLAGKRVQLLDVLPTGGSLLVSATPGEAVYQDLDESIRIACRGASSIKVKALKTEGRKALSAKQWWIGAAHSEQSIQFGS